MNTRVQVIATFSTDAQIRPLWLRIPSDDSFVDCKVLNCVCASDETKWGGNLTYLCTIKDSGVEKEIKLYYHITEHYWTIIINNSRRHK